MDDVDLRGTRKRATSLAIAAAIGLVVTIVATRLMAAVSREPNGDPIGASIEPLLAIAVFVVTTAWLAGVIARLRR